MPSHRHYQNRQHAGDVLAQRLESFSADALHVLALPRGGVPVGAEVARALHAPLDVLVVRQLSVTAAPGAPIGAIGPGGVLVLNHDVISRCGISPEEITTATGREREELERQEELYRRGHPPLEIKDSTIVLVDDSLENDATIRAAITAVRAHQPARVLAAVPVGAREMVEAVTPLVDAMICPFTPEPMIAVDLWYDDFPPISDEDVREQLDRARAHSAQDGRQSNGAASHHRSAG